MGALQRRLRVTHQVMTALACIAIGLGAQAAGVLDGLERRAIDTRFDIRGERTPPRNVLLVLVDDVTFSDLKLQWPFARSVHAKLVDRVSAAGAKLLAYDVQFSEPGARPADDLAFANALANASMPVELATTEVDDQGSGRFLGITGVPREIRAQLANGLFPNDPDGVIRRIDARVDGLESFAVASARRAGGPRIDTARFPAWIDFAGSAGVIPSVHFSDLVRGRVPRSLLKGRIVVVGASAPSLQDRHATSSTDAELMAGPEIQANAIQTALGGLPLRSGPGWLDVVLVMLMGAVAPAAVLRWSALRGFAVAVAAAIAFAVGAQVAFDRGSIVSVAYPLGALVLAAAAALALHAVGQAFERARVRDLFARFVPEGVVDEVLASTGDGARLGGVHRVGTVLFSDLRGFTSFAERRTPNEVIEVLNNYLTEMSDAILDHGGTLVSYMGDGIMAVFGAPIVQDDHADRALETAREMLDERLPRFNDWMRSNGLGDGFRMGIGINSGPLLSGNVGSERRLEYTAIGDTTNTAARLEGMTKGTPHQLFVAEATQVMLTRPAADLAFVYETEIRGRETRVRLWSLVGEAPRASAAD